MMEQRIRMEELKLQAVQLDLDLERRWRSSVVALVRGGARARWRSSSCAVALLRGGARTRWRGGARARWRSCAVALVRGGAGDKVLSRVVHSTA